MSAETDRLVTEATRSTRNMTLDAAIQICEDFSRTGHSAACCAKALRDMKDMMNQVLPQPSKGH